MSRYNKEWWKEIRDTYNLEEDYKPLVSYVGFGGIKTFWCQFPYPHEPTRLTYDGPHSGWNVASSGTLDRQELLERLLDEEV